MEGIDWSGEQNGGKWMTAIDGRDMDTRAAKDENGGTRKRPYTAATGTRGGKWARTTAADTRAAKNGRNGDTAVRSGQEWPLQ